MPKCVRFGYIEVYLRYFGSILRCVIFMPVANFQPAKLLDPAGPTGRLALLALGSVLLAGCQSLNANSAQLRVIDASPDAGVVDVYQNNSGLAYNLQFGTVTSYVPMTTGSYTLAADRAGTRQALVSSYTQLSAPHQYTEIVGNTAASMQQIVLQDQTVPAPTGEMEIRLVQQATRSGAVDVYLVQPGGKLSTTAPIATNLSFGANSGYLTVPAGTYAIDVVPTGTALTSSTTTLMSGAQNEYSSGAVRTVVLIDQEIVGPQRAALTAGVQAIIADDVDGAGN